MISKTAITILNPTVRITLLNNFISPCQNSVTGAGNSVFINATESKGYIISFYIGVQGVF